MKKWNAVQRLLSAIRGGAGLILARLRSWLLAGILVGGCSLAFWGGEASAASLTLAIPAQSLSVDVTPSTFKASGAGAISIKTDAPWGYNLNLTTGTELKNGGASLKTIDEALSAEEFSANGHENMWGFMPSKVNGQANAQYLPGTSVATNLGKTTGANAENTFSEIVMPETTRTVTRAIDDLPVIGVVKLEQTISYAREQSTVSSNLVICPIWFMLVVGMAIAAIIGAVAAIIVRRRRKRMII